MNIRKTLVILLVLLSSAALFAGTTGSLTLTGTVNGVLDIQVTPDAAASNLDLATSQADLNIATVVEKSNKVDGYTVELESANAAAGGSSQATLESSDANNSDTLNYTLTYDGVNVTFVNGVAQVTDSTSTTSAAGVSKTLAISYTADASLTEGSYSDTITLTIAAK